MTCTTCGVTLPSRPKIRFFITGVLLIVAAFVLVAFVHLAVTVLAAVVMTVFGMSMISGARRAKRSRCPNCGAQLR